jgi:hypothetical protein
MISLLQFLIKDLIIEGLKRLLIADFIQEGICISHEEISIFLNE